MSERHTPSTDTATTNHHRTSGKNTDNRSLSPNRRRDIVENDEFGAFARRIVRAYARRVATGEIEALAALIKLGDAVEDATQNAVIGLRQHGYSWTDIGTRLGISRQAARQKWSDPNH